MALYDGSRSKVDIRLLQAAAWWPRLCITEFILNCESWSCDLVLCDVYLPQPVVEVDFLPGKENIYAIMKNCDKRGVKGPA